MSDSSDKYLRLHHAGATVRHKSRFDGIVVPKLENALSQDIVDKWVKPFYRSRIRNDREIFVSALRPIFAQLDDSLISTLLSEFNWRPRIVAAYFSAISISDSHEEHIGKLLLRSDLCNAGRGYCLALARFGTDTSINYLVEYLDYYLSQKDLYFDQGFAMAALAYLDAQNGTDNIATLLPDWTSFVQDKTNWSLDSFSDIFSNQIANIDWIARQLPDNKALDRSR